MSIQETQATIADNLKYIPIGHGVGTTEKMCSIAHINYALSGRVADAPIPCVSAAIRRWVITIQDKMPVETLNGPEWKSLVPLIAGTGQKYEQERANIILNWLWDVVLLQIQPIADKYGFGGEWQLMLTERTEDAASEVAWAAALAVDVKRAEDAARAAVVVARAVAFAADFNATDFWQAVDPARLLKRLIEVE